MIQHARHRIRLPDVNFSSQPESDVYFVLDHEDGRSEHIRFHDYDSIYGIPGLYEQIFYERLKCDSPRFLAQRLHQVMAQSGDDLNRQRELDDRKSDVRGKRVSDRISFGGRRVIKKKKK